MGAVSRFGFMLRSKYGKPIIVNKQRAGLSLNEILKLPNLKLILIYPNIMVDVEKGITEEFRQLWARKFNSRSTSSVASFPSS